MALKRLRRTPSLYPDLLVMIHELLSLSGIPEGNELNFEI